MISLRLISGQLRPNASVSLKALIEQTGLKTLRALFVRSLADKYNQPPYLIGLPVAAELNAVEIPVVTCAPDGRFYSVFRGAIINDRTR